MDYRFTADVTAEDYYLAVIVTDADGSVIPVEKIPDGGGERHARHQGDDGADDNFIHLPAQARLQQQEAAQGDQGAGQNVDHDLVGAARGQKQHEDPQHQPREKGRRAVQQTRLPAAFQLPPDLQHGGESARGDDPA